MSADHPGPTPTADPHPSATRPTPVLDPATVAAVVAHAADPGGTVAADAVTIEVAPGEWGAGTYAATVLGGPDGWDQPLIVRVAGPDDPLRAATEGAEAAWHRFLSERGVAVPPILATGIELDGLSAVVMGRTHPYSVIDAIAASPGDAATLLAAAGQTHVAVHAVPVVGVPVGLGAVDPVSGLADGAERYDWYVEHEWLSGHRPPPAADPVVCHGNLSPSQIRMDPTDVDHPVVTSWTGSIVDDRERDVAKTALALWSTPYVTPRRADRMMLKLFRDTLVEQYQTAYAAAAGVELDPARLAYWRAVHILDWSVGVGRRLEAIERDPWDPAFLLHKPEAFRKDLRTHFWEQARTADR